VADNVAVLRQATDLLARVEPCLYAAAGPRPGWGGAGSHVRHCLDFYACFLAGLPAGRIDYNARERNEMVAKDPAAARALIERVTDALEALPARSAVAAVRVRAEGAGDPADPASWSRSTVARELQFLVSHTIHHYALVAMTLRLRGFEPGEEFGVAPSTLEYWRNAS
jgi:hypothetical protein